MRYSRGPDGGVIEHDNPNRRRTYGDPAIKPRPEVEERMRRVTLPIKIAGAVLRRATRFLRVRGIRGLLVNASFSEDGYHLHATVMLKGQQSKVVMFAEMPEGQYKVWP